MNILNQETDHCFLEVFKMNIYQCSNPQDVLPTVISGCGSPVLRRSHAKIQSCGTCMRRSGSGAAGSCVASLKTLCMLRRMRRCMLRNCRTRILQSGLQLGSAAVHIVESCSDNRNGRFVCSGIVVHRTEDNACLLSCQFLYIFCRIGSIHQSDVSGYVNDHMGRTGNGGLKQRAGNRLILSVADTGQGMKPSDRQRIFREFTRLPGAQGEEGFGLGLSIVQMLVQLLRGTITVDSELGKGSTFTVDLPLHRIDTAVGNDRKKAAASEATPSAPHPADHLQPRRLLLIDDDRIQLTLTAAMLQQNGFEAVTCLQTDELLDALRTGHFLALLTDVQMPAINGFDLLKLLRASNVGQSRTLPIIAVTARSDMERDDFVAHGFAGCLHKPFNMQELLQELERVFNQQDDQPTTSVRAESPAKASETNENSPSETVNSSAAPKLTQQADAINLSALTAFSGDDEEAARDILNSFMEESDKNIERLKQAVEQSDPEGISAVAHKMLPLFTLIGANSLTVLLRTLEAARFNPHTPQLDETARQALAKAQNILDTCRKQMAGSN